MDMKRLINSQAQSGAGSANAERAAQRKITEELDAQRQAILKELDEKVRRREQARGGGRAR